MQEGIKECGSFGKLLFTFQGEGAGGFPCPLHPRL